MIKIPKIIHFIWVGTKPFPFDKNIKIWKSYHSDWKFNLWTDSNIPLLYNQDIYNKVPIEAIKADILRIELLYNYGGIYIDVDSWCLKSINPLIDNLTLFSSTTRGKSRRVNNGFLGSVINHPAYYEAVYSLPVYWENLQKQMKQFPIYCFGGTQYLHNILTKYNDFVQIDKNKKEERGRFICSSVASTNETYIVQNYAGTWKKKMLPGKKWKVIK